MKEVYIMNTKRFLACLLASAMMCGAMASCGSEKKDSDSSSKKAETTEAETTTAEETTAAEEETTVAAETVAIEATEFEDSIVAESGDAYLAIVDGQWWIQYWGKEDQTMLTYNAGVEQITGNGDYTVSVTADTNGFRYDTTGDASDTSCVPSGLEFLSVMIKDGETKFPGAVITVNSIKVDGNEIPMSAKAYTSSDDGVETRANLFNKYVNEPSPDARSVDGNLYDADGNATPACADYSPQVVSPDDFASWTTVEVNFTISGMDTDKAADGGDTAADEAAPDEAPAEEETTAE